MHLIVLFTISLLISPILIAQDATPEPTPSATASPSPEATLTLEPTPSATVSPSPEATLTLEPTPSASPDDVIPLPADSGSVETPIVSDSEVTPVEKINAGDGLPDSSFTDPNGVIPGDGLSDIPAAPPTGPTAGELERKLKIRYKEVRTKVENDPAVQSLLEQAQTAKSFEDERAAYREFYRLMFKKMKKIDKELTERCDAMEKAYLARLAQTRLEPTIPLNPPPQPQTLAN